MDHQDIIRLLNTDHYAPADLEEINGICRNYPMFGLAHMLKIRIKEVLGYEMDRDLKIAAVYSSDRKQLYQLVQEVSGTHEDEDEPEEVEIESGGIQFSNEPHQQADVIIEQHAPYAASETGDDLLELDEDPPAEEISSETLIEAVAKDDAEMEEPASARESVPVMDELKPENTGSENNRLILEFIEEEPGPIRADKKTGLRGDVSLASIREHDGFITDTLAQIYVKQGLYAKAIYAYEKLSLKYPEKSAYFAAQIEKIKNINHS